MSDIIVHDANYVRYKRERGGSEIGMVDLNNVDNTNSIDENLEDTDSDKNTNKDIKNNVNNNMNNI